MGLNWFQTNYKSKPFFADLLCCMLHGRFLVLLSIFFVVIFFSRKEWWNTKSSQKKKKRRTTGKGAKIMVV